MISFHNYDPPAKMAQAIHSLRQYERPLICTEYMARPVGSTFAGVLPVLHDQHAWAYNWGFVDGKSNTIYPWDSWQVTYNGEPPEWFHDIFRPDGTPYRDAEVAVIRAATGKR